MSPVPAFGMALSGVVWFWMLSSGLVLPLGLPPGPEDPVAANVAPQECLFYLGWAGMAKPDPKSTNQLEALFAEPEIQQLVAQVERYIRDGLRRSAGRGNPEAAGMVDDVIWLAKKAISSPGALCVRSLELRGPRPPGVQAGAVIGLGDEAAKVRQLLDKYVQMIPPGRLEAVKIGGQPFYQIKLDAESPVIAWGIHGSHFVVGLGDGEAEALVKRMDGKPPEWLAGVRRQLVVDRPATVSYLNVTKIVQMIRAAAGPEAEPVMGALGLHGFLSYASVSGLDKDGYVSKSLLSTVKQEGDILSFLNAKPLEAKDLAPIPRDATWACAARIEPDRIWQTIVSAITKANPRGSEEIAQVVDKIEKKLEFKLREDLLEPLGGVWSVYNSPGEGGFIVTGLTAVGQLKDAKRAKATHDRVLAAIKQDFEQMQRAFQSGDFRPPVRQFKCAGQDVYMLELPFTPLGPELGPSRRGPGGDFPFAPSWCITDKELIVALFPQNVKAYLLRGAEYQSLASLPDVAEMLKSGPVAMTYVNQPELFRTIYPLVQFALPPLAAQLRREGIDVDMAVFPSAAAIGKHLRPGVTAVRRTADGIETTTRQSLPGGDIGTSAPVMVALLLPAVQAARDAGRRVQCTNNLRQIGLALLNYENANKSFPPAYSLDKNGKPLLSWRVLILPYLEGQALYQQFHLDEPWDSEHNKKLIPLMPAVYRCPSGQPLPGKTTYLTVRGKDTIFPGEKGISLRDITDGTSMTILVVEAGDQSAVEWTRPDDFVPDPKDPTKGLLGHHAGGFHAVFADCSAHFINAAIDPKVLRALFTRNGGERMDPDDIHGPPRRGLTPPPVKIKEAGPVPPPRGEKPPEKAAVPAGKE